MSFILSNEYDRVHSIDGLDSYKDLILEFDSVENGVLKNSITNLSDEITPAVDEVKGSFLYTNQSNLYYPTVQYRHVSSPQQVSQRSSFFSYPLTYGRGQNYVAVPVLQVMNVHRPKQKENSKPRSILISMD